MRVYRTTYSDKQGGSHAAANWYIEFRDHREAIRRIAGYADRKATLELGRKIERLAWAKGSGEALDPVLTKWVEDLSPRLRDSLQRYGLLDAAKVAALEPLAKHVDGVTDTQGRITFVGFRQALAAKGNTAGYVETTCTRARKVIEGCRFNYWSDISPSKVMTFLDGLRADKADGKGGSTQGLSAQTFNFYLSAFKQFCRWMVKDGRASVSPVAHLDGFNVKTDRRHDRRALSVEELRWLLATVHKSRARTKLKGPQRAALYKLAVETGLRRAELASLKRSSFALEGDRPTVTVAAAYSKHRRQDVLPLRPDTAADLRTAFACKLPDAPAFDMPTDSHSSAEMFQRDLTAARAAWIAQAATEQERQERQASSFLTYVDSAGRYADFHSLRHTCGSLLAANGVHPKVAQSIMRHCTIDLTMSRYSHVFAGQEADAVAALPALDLPVAQAAKATGTDGRAIRNQARPADRPNLDEAGPKGDRKNFARFLAQQGTFSGTLRPQDAREAREKPLAENSGNPLENTQEYSDTSHPEVTGSLVEPLVFKTSVGPYGLRWVRFPFTSAIYTKSAGKRWPAS